MSKSKANRILTLERRFLSRSPMETGKLAARLAPHLKVGDTLLLYSNLGGGKTTFAQALLRSLKVRDAVLSPTFVLAQSFRGRITVHHLDFYRLTPREILDMGIQDYFQAKGEIRPGVVVIEWAQRCREIWPKERLEIHIKILKKSGHRSFLIRGVGRRPVFLAEKL